MSAADRLEARVDADESRREPQCKSCTEGVYDTLHELIQKAIELRSAGRCVTWRLLADLASEEHDGFAVDVTSLKRHYQRHEPDLYAAYVEAAS